MLFNDRRIGKMSDMWLQTRDSLDRAKASGKMVTPAQAKIQKDYLGSAESSFQRGSYKRVEKGRKKDRKAGM